MYLNLSENSVKPQKTFPVRNQAKISELFSIWSTVNFNIRLATAEERRLKIRERASFEHSMLKEKTK